MSVERREEEDEWDKYADFPPNYSGLCSTGTGIGKKSE
jgi:hypothetical protein